MDKKYQLTIAHCLVRKGKAHVTFFASDAVPAFDDNDDDFYTIGSI